MITNEQRPVAVGFAGPDVVQEVVIAGSVSDRQQEILLSRIKLRVTGVWLRPSACNSNVSGAFDKGRGLGAKQGGDRGGSFGLVPAIASVFRSADFSIVSFANRS